MIKKGTKFNQKNLVAIDYSIVNPTNWTADERN
jgi:DNA-directed RNA polymerase subunit beta